MIILEQMLVLILDYFGCFYAFRCCLWIKLLFIFQISRWHLFHCLWDLDPLFYMYIHVYVYACLLHFCSQIYPFRNKKLLSFVLLLLLWVIIYYLWVTIHVQPFCTQLFFPWKIITLYIYNMYDGTLQTKCL